jgi:hypothetical protein
LQSGLIIYIHQRFDRRSPLQRRTFHTHSVMRLVSFYGSRAGHGLLSFLFRGWGPDLSHITIFACILFAANLELFISRPLPLPAVLAHRSLPGFRLPGTQSKSRLGYTRPNCSVSRAIGSKLSSGWLRQPWWQSDTNYMRNLLGALTMAQFSASHRVLDCLSTHCGNWSIQ